MATIHYLNASDFGQEGNHLVANIGGLTFVMFHSQRCSYCNNFLPEFKQLPNILRGINFGLCSVDDGNRALVQMSKASSTPISAVPKFVLYNNGIPYAEYTGQRSRQAVIAFLQEVIGKISQPQGFARPRRTRQEQPMPPMQAPTQPPAQGTPSRPPSSGMPQANSSVKITPSTGVKEYETSYGRPYNTLNENDFLEYENAYKQMQAKKGL